MDEEETQAMGSEGTASTSRSEPSCSTHAVLVSPSSTEVQAYDKMEKGFSEGREKEEATAAQIKTTTTSDFVPNADPTPSHSMDESESENTQVSSHLADDIDAETAEMYAEVASILVNKVNEPVRKSDVETPQNLNSSSKSQNESLSLIMAYNETSDEESGEETEKEEESTNNFTGLQYQTISSGCSSDDDASSEDENTDAGSSGNEHEIENDSDVEIVPPSATITEEPGGAEGQGPKKVKERKGKELRDPLMLDLLPPIEKLSISVPEEDCVPVGKVYSIVDRLLVIESLPDTPPLMLDSVIFTRDGSPVGQIFDIFGHVKRPFYSIRFNSPDDITTLNVDVGRVVYCAPKTDHTSYVFTHDLIREKGSDASWKDDVEPPANCVEYSDDEAERSAKKGGKVKVEKEIDSPARRRHLSFEQQMNRNNTMRNRAFKRDSQGEARNWDGGWHNYKKSNPQFQQMSCDPPPPPPRQIQPCVYSNPAVNPLNLVIRPPCFNPVIERPPVGFQSSPSAFQLTPPPWARFEPPPTPPPRGFQGYPNSPPTNGGAFQRFEPVQGPPAFGLSPFSSFPSSPPSSNSVFQGFGSPSHYGPPPSGFGHPAPRFSSPPPPPIPIQQPPAPSRFGGAPSNCHPSLPIPPPPFSTNPFNSYHASKPINSNNPNNLQPRIPRLPFSNSNNNHPPLFNHPPF